ncbi:MAG: PQQ-binding-like beta-propeller repeat protein [Gammaproteobacteria bacterium]
MNKVHTLTVIKAQISRLVAVVLCLVSVGANADAEVDGRRLATVLLAKYSCSVTSKAPHCGMQTHGELRVKADKNNTPMSLGVLAFPLAGIPRGAKVKDMSLRLYLKSKQPEKGRQVVSAFAVAGDASGACPGWKTWKDLPQEPQSDSVGFADVRMLPPESTGAPVRVDLKLNPRKVGLDTEYLCLVLRSPTGHQDYAYFGHPGSTQSSDDNGLAEQPKLMLGYSLSGLSSGLDWAQYSHDAQHSGRTPWRLQVTPKAYSKPVVVYNADGYIQGRPVMYRGALVFHEQRHETNEKFFMTATDSSGKRLWRQSLEQVAKFTPVVDRNGVMLVVTEDSLLGFDLNNAGHKLGGLALEEILPGAHSIHADPTLGEDGTLYLATDSGMYALTRAHNSGADINSGWRLRWRNLNAKARFGKIVLSRDEGLAYAFDMTNKQVVALDTADGSLVWQHSLPTSPDAHIFLAADSSTERLFVVARGSESGWLTVLYKKEKDKDVISATTLTGQFSAPAVGRDGSVYFVGVNEGICKLAAGHNKPQCRDKGTGLSEKSTLVIDGAGLVYVLDPGRDPQLFLGYDPSLQPLFRREIKRTRVASENTSRNFKPGLLVGIDGSLYAWNDNHLFAFLPTGLPEEEVEAAAVNRMAYVAGQVLSVKSGTGVSRGTAVTYKAAEGIRIPPGFHVEQGARLTLRVSGSTE